MKGEISYELEGNSKNHPEGDVEIYDFNLTARIPTTKENASYVLYRLVGHDLEPIMISPTGGTAGSHIHKPIDHLHTDTGLSGGYTGEGDSRRKYTDEDAARFWLLNNPEFRQELIEGGWTYFPAAKETTEYFRSQIDSTDRSSFHRESSVSDVLRMLDGTRKENEYETLISDLSELGQYGDELHFVWGVGGFSFSYMFMPIVYQDEKVGLILRDAKLGSSIGENLLQRRVELDVGFSGNASSNVPSWWQHSHGFRVKELLNEYSSNLGLKGGVLIADNNNGLTISARDRDSENDKDPNTGEFLDKVVKTKKMALELIAAEHADNKQEESDLMNQRREQFNLNSKTSK